MKIANENSKSQNSTSLLIKHGSKTYKVNFKKLINVLSLLSNKNLNSASEAELINTMNSYKLLDEVFLNSINNI